jgi:chemotaxis protein MotB
MSVMDGVDEGAGEGYFASASDLMVGILFVFLLMLTVFALNYKDAEDDQRVEKARYELALGRAATAEKRAEQAEAQAKIDAAKAADQLAENQRLRALLKSAVARLQQDVRGRTEARERLLNSLEQQLAAKGVKVFIDPLFGILRLPEELLFDVGESSIRKDRKDRIAALNTLADVLAQVLACFGANGEPSACDGYSSSILETVLVEGHTDRQGYRRKTVTAGRSILPSLSTTVPTEAPAQHVSPEESQNRNDRLSTERALTVFRELQRVQPTLSGLRNGENQPLLGFSGYGDRRPLPEAEGSTADDYRKNRRIDLRFVLSARSSSELERLLKQIEDVLGGRP